MRCCGDRDERSLRCLHDVVALGMAQQLQVRFRKHQCPQLLPPGPEVDGCVRAVEAVCVRRETISNRIDLLDEEEITMFFA